MDSHFSSLPRLRAQMEPLHHTDAYPAFGRTPLDHSHAPYCVVMLLQRLGLSCWTGRVLTWLASYDGLEQHLDCDPACSTRDVLFHHVLTQAPVPAGPLSAADIARRKRSIVDDLLTLEFLRCRAYWGPFLVKRLAWEPLQQTWLNFLEAGPEWPDADNGLHIWTQHRGGPDHRRAVRVFLLGPGHGGAA
jgi:hypothetical protein